MGAAAPARICPIRSEGSRTEEPFGQDWRFLGMITPAEAAKNTIELGKKHIHKQCRRIEQQHELIARLERDGHIDLVAEAVGHLGDMRKMLA